MTEEAKPDKPVVEPAKVLTKAEIRALILNAKPDSKMIPFKGAQIELRQPTLGETLEFQNVEGDDQKQQGVRILTNYAYVPGGERLFDDTDIEGILNSPFNPDIQLLLTSCYELMGVSVKEDDKSTTEE